MTAIEGIPSAGETPNCLLCGSEEGGEVVGRSGRFGMSITNICCQRCGLVYITPRPNVDQMAEYYRGTYRRHYGSVGYATSGGRAIAAGHSDFEKERERWHQAQLLNALTLAKPQAGERILEVGCRHARTLCLQREKFGIRPYGIEPGETEAAEAREAGVECFCGPLEDYDPGETRFDQIQLFHVLEHLHQPLDALLRLRSWLTPGGRLLIEVPNLYQPYGMLEDNFFQNVHLVTFSPLTLGTMLERAGFIVSQVLNERTLFTLAVVNESARALPLPFEAKRLALEEHTPRWIVDRLYLYSEIEKCVFLMESGATDTQVVRYLMRLVREPAFEATLLRAVTRVATLLTQRNEWPLASMLVGSAVMGQHSDGFRHGLEPLLALLNPTRGAAQELDSHQTTRGV